MKFTVFGLFFDFQGPEPEKMYHAWDAASRFLLDLLVLRKANDQLRPDIAFANGLACAIGIAFRVI